MALVDKEFKLVLASEMCISTMRSEYMLCGLPGECYSG